MTPRSRPPTCWLPATLLLATLLLAGCGGAAPDADLGDPLDVLARLEEEHQRRSVQQYVELELGEFFVIHRVSDRLHGLGVNFQLFAVVPGDRQAEFNRALGLRKQRMRDRVIGLIQRTDAQQLTSADLGLLKADLTKECRQALQAPWLKEVAISEFSVDLR